jgi:hypothetical protein
LSSAFSAIEQSAWGVALRDSPWLYTSAGIVHVLGVALLVGSIVMLDLRLLGLSREIPVRRLARHVLPWAGASLVLIVPSGFTMFIAFAGELIASPVFALKMCLILAALGNAAVLHAGVMRGAAAWDTGVRPPLAARAAAAASLAFWVSVVVCGRLLAIR